MKLQKGTTFGPYRIEDSIGAGGMGEVYRARDTRLDRSVAIKVIPPHLASRSEVRERFEREARVVSSLSHPNICVLHDVGEETVSPSPGSSSEPVQYIVMELLQGETLEERIGRGSLATFEAVAIGIQIARALEHAHAHGVVHRDLKPSNVMLTPSGVKILDFGLSKMLRQSEEELLADRSETVHKAITEEGVILGTLQYMAPEQAEGKPADARTDIFALGAILYEMVTGHRAFEGKSRASLIAAIMAIDPPEVTTMRPEAPPALERVIENCLAKDQDDRWQSAHDVRMALEMAAADRGGKRGAADTSRWKVAVPWAIAALALLAAAALALRPGEREEPKAFQFEILPGDLSYSWAGSPAKLSPDGRELLVALWDPDGGGESALYVRDLDSLEFRKLGPQGMVYDAAWSWDGESVLFFHDFEMKTISAGGGPVKTLASTGDSRGAAWGADGRILFAPELAEGIHLIDAVGGEPRRITTIDVDAGEIGHVRPEPLPDGRHFLFLVRSNDAARRGIYVGSLDGSAHRFLLGSVAAPVFAAPDRLLYHHQGSLYAQRLDMDRIIPVGAPQLVARLVSYDQQYDNPGYSASRNGVLSWHRSSGEAGTPILVYDRSGNKVDAPAMEGQNLDLARDDTKLAANIGTGEGPDLWVWDLERGIRTRVTSDDSPDIGPVWSPDGSWLAYSVPGNPTRIYRKRSSGVGASELIFEGGKFGGEAIDWSRDGRWLLVEMFTQENLMDIFTLDLQQEAPSLEAVVSTRFDEGSGRFSPDARWISYQANDSGREEIFVQRFPPDGSRWQVSVDGGSSARWKGDGTEIYWVSRGSVMAADVDVSSGFRVSNLRKLFDAPSSDWVVASDGERFIIAAGQVTSSAPVVIDNGWMD